MSMHHFISLEGYAGISHLAGVEVIAFRSDAMERSNDWIETVRCDTTPTRFVQMYVRVW